MSPVRLGLVSAWSRRSLQVIYKKVSARRRSEHGHSSDDQRFDDEYDEKCGGCADVDVGWEISAGNSGIFRTRVTFWYIHTTSQPSQSTDQTNTKVRLQLPKRVQQSYLVLLWFSEFINQMLNGLSINGESVSAKIISFIYIVGNWKMISYCSKNCFGKSWQSMDDFYGQSPKF